MQIKKLSGAHLVPNKLSEKMNRRDVQFYDLYKLAEPREAVLELKEEGFLEENIYQPAIYEDIEVQDFN